MVVVVKCCLCYMKQTFLYWEGSSAVQSCWTISFEHWECPLEVEPKCMAETKINHSSQAQKIILLILIPAVKAFVKNICGNFDSFYFRACILMKYFDFVGVSNEWWPLTSQEGSLAKKKFKYVICWHIIYIKYGNLNFKQRNIVSLTVFIIYCTNIYFIGLSHWGT